MLIFTCTRSLLQVEMLTTIEVAALPSSVQETWGGSLCTVLAAGLWGHNLWRGQSLLLQMGWSQNGERFFFGGEVSKWSL